MEIEIPLPGRKEESRWGEGKRYVRVLTSRDTRRGYAYLVIGRNMYEYDNTVRLYSFQVSFVFGYGRGGTE